MPVKMMIWVKILLVASHVRQEVTEEGSISMKNAQEDKDMVAHDGKSPKRGGRTTSFECTVTIGVVNKMLIDITASLIG